jgi:hypothetical protein
MSELIEPLPPPPLPPPKKIRKIIIKKSKSETTENIKINPDDPHDKESITKSKKNKTKSKLEKPNPSEISFHNYNILNEENEKNADYKVAELKEMCAIIQRDFDYKKIKLSGTKSELRQGVYQFYHHTFHCIKIQLKFNCFLRRKLNKLRGPALHNREICVNETDFYSLDPIRDIPNHQFFSYEEFKMYHDNDSNNKNDNNDSIRIKSKSCYYGFDIASIYNLILSDNGVENEYALSRRLVWIESNNPYNRNKIPSNVICNILKIIKLDRILNKKRVMIKNKNKNKRIIKNQIMNNNDNNYSNNNNNYNNNNYEYDNNNYIEEDNDNNNNNNNNISNMGSGGSINITLPQDILTPQQRFRQHVLRLFQTINALGHYSDPDWFIALTYEQHITFLRELIDIWNYRAELSPQVRRTIYPPYGDPFPQYILSWVTHQFYIYLSPENIININLNVIERLITSAVAESDRCLGSNFILCALTLVSIPAREALPWLYQSVMHG